MCAGSIVKEESKEEKNREEMWSEILDKRISELINSVKSLKKEILKIKRKNCPSILLSILDRIFLRNVS